MSAPQQMLLAGGPAVDTQFGSVSLLVHGDANFADSSSLSLSPALSATNPTIDTGVKVFGAGAMYFGPSGAQNVTYSDNPGLAFAGDWTLEWRMRIESYNGSTTYMMGRTAHITHYFSYSSSGGAVRFSCAGATLSFTAITLATATWYAIRVVHSGTTLYAFVDGALVGSTSGVGDESSGGPGYGTLRLAEGGNNDGFYGTAFHGWIDEVRFTKAARSTANYTLDSAAFPNS